MRIIIILLLFILFLSACSPIKSSEELLDLQDVIEAFKEQGLYLHQGNSMPLEFNGVKSDEYKLEKEWIYIFSYKSVEERSIGVEEYTQLRKESVGTGWIPGEIYELDNVFILHLIENEDLNIEISKIIASFGKD